MPILSGTAREWSPTFGASWKTVWIIAYMANVIALSVVPDSFAGERERHTLEKLLASRLADRSILLGKYAAAILYSLVFAVIVLALGIVTAVVTTRTPLSAHLAPLIIVASMFAAFTCGCASACRTSSRSWNAAYTMEIFPRLPRSHSVS